MREVRTLYTLLLDADIELAPGIVIELQQKARNENLALVSLIANPPMRNFKGGLLMPTFIFYFKLLYPFGLENKPESRVAAAAGGCILEETQVSRAIGAFVNLHNAMIDDYTLATRIKRAVLRIFIGLSHAARSHRDYQDLKPIWEMVACTAYTQLRYSFFICQLHIDHSFHVFGSTTRIFAVIYSGKVYWVSALAWMVMFNL